MNRIARAFFALVAIGFAACSGRVIERLPIDRLAEAGAPDAKVTGTPRVHPEASSPPTRPDASTRVADSSARPPDSSAPADAAPPTSDHDVALPPNPACPDVPGAPIPNRSDSGGQGLAALRALVLSSREAVQKYTALHSDTYRYTRYRESFSGSACKTTVRVLNGAINVMTVSQLEPGGASWSTNDYSAGDPKAASCFTPLTIYELYEQCLSDVLCKDPAKNIINVHVDARGLLVECSYAPIDCVDDCSAGFGPILLTVNGRDWTAPLPGCCEPSSGQACCMDYGGSGPNCATTCDGMPNPGNPGWHIAFSREGCAQWVEPHDGTRTDCCGCGLPDAGVADAGRRDAVP